MITRLLFFTDLSEARGFVKGLKYNTEVPKLKPISVWGVGKLYMLTIAEASDAVDSIRVAQHVSGVKVERVHTTEELEAMT